MAALPDLLTGRELTAFDDAARQARRPGGPEDLATRVAVLPPAYAALNIVETAKRDELDPLEVARVHFALGERLGLSALVDRILALPREDRWQTMARAALRDDLHAVHAQLTAQVLAETDGSPAGAGAHLRLGGGGRGGRLPCGGDARRDLRRRPRRPGPALGRAARGADDARATP